MVLTDLSQLSAECKDWRQILKNYKEEFTDSRTALIEICRQELSRNQLTEMEHFENQFHIQLVNIHDLKQKIKWHEKKVESENNSDDALEKIFAEHEILLEQFLVLENTFQELRISFKNFISQSSC